MERSDPSYSTPWCKLSTATVFLISSMLLIIISLTLDEWYFQDYGEDYTFWTGGVLGLNEGEEDSYEESADLAKDIRDFYIEDSAGYEAYDDLYHVFLRLHGMGVSLAVLEGIGLLVLLIELALIIGIFVTKTKALFHIAVFLAFIIFRTVLSIALVFVHFLGTSCFNFL